MKKDKKKASGIKFPEGDINRAAREGGLHMEDPFNQAPGAARKDWRPGSPPSSKLK